MKKLFISLFAVAAVAACTKSEVAYEAPNEIGFAPVTGNVTKASGKSGALDANQELGVWAYWDKDGAVETQISDFTKYDDAYLVNALFVNKSGTSWGAPANNSYPWPVNGSLVFAGYTTPGDTTLGAAAVGYVLSTDTMTFTGYENTNEFDLCWFGRTAASYNNKSNGTAVTVNLAHALSWVSVAVCGEGNTIGNWTIKSIELGNVISKGTATCKAKTATWSSSQEGTKSIYTGSHTLTAGTTVNNKITGTKLSDNVLIPSKDVTLTVNYEFLVNGVSKSDSKTLTLNTAATWESGKHYTYTLVFKSNEILVAPSYDNWGTSDNTVTVE